MFHAGSGSRFVSVFLLTSLVGFGSFAVAQDVNADAGRSVSTSPAGEGSQQGDPLKRPVGEKQKKENAKSLKQELGKTYKKWLDEDVRWIISDEERAAFKQLSNDEERDQFIEGFWQRRDPTPDTVENGRSAYGVHRTILASPRSKSRHSTERIQG